MGATVPLLAKIALFAFLVGVGTIDLLSYRNYEKSETWRKTGNVLLTLRLVSDKRNLITFSAIHYTMALLILVSIFTER